MKQRFCKRCRHVEQRSRGWVLFWNRDFEKRSRGRVTLELFFLEQRFRKTKQRFRKTKNYGKIWYVFSPHFRPKMRLKELHLTFVMTKDCGGKMKQRFRKIKHSGKIMKIQLFFQSGPGFFRFFGPSEESLKFECFPIIIFSIRFSIFLICCRFLSFSGAGLAC